MKIPQGLKLYKIVQYDRTGRRLYFEDYHTLAHHVFEAQFFYYYEIREVMSERTIRRSNLGRLSTIMVEVASVSSSELEELILKYRRVSKKKL